jgi:hypothetical protein
MLISWKQPSSGDFATASNWNPAAVPGPADEVFIIGLPASYTVTSSANETVDSLGIVNAELFLTGASTFTTTNGGFNAGTILVDNSSALNVGTAGQSTTLTNLSNIEISGELTLAGEVSLQGHGNVVLDNGTILTGTATLSSDNLISGSGSIAGTHGFPLPSSVTLINKVGGIIDATGSLDIGNINFENSGILESTATSGLLTSYATIDNTPNCPTEPNRWIALAGFY